MPSTKAAFPYDLSVYDSLYRFSQDELIAKYDGTDSEAYLRKMTDLFNKEKDKGLPDSIRLSRQCYDYAVFYDLAEQMYDCGVQAEFGCTCQITISGLVVKDYEIDMYGGELRLVKYDGEDVGLSIPLPFLVDSYTRYTGDPPISTQGLKLKIVQEKGIFKKAEFDVYNEHGRPTGGGWFGDLGGKTFLMYRSKNGIELTKQTGFQVCQEKKHYYALCAEQTDTKIKMVRAGKLIEEPVRIRFAVELPSVQISSDQRSTPQ
jgi:hypothetical protein